MSAPWPHGDPRAVARAILSDSRYTGLTSAKKPEPTLWDRIWQWIAERLRDFFLVIGHAVGAQNPWTRTLGFLAIAAAIVLVAFVIFRIVSAFATATPRRAGGSRSVALGIESRTSRELRDDAIAAASAGRYREAAARYFEAAVRLLDECGAVAYDAARTPGEYRRLVREPAFDALARGAVVALFDDAEPDAALVSEVARSFDAFAAVRSSA